MTPERAKVEATRAYTVEPFIGHNGLLHGFDQPRYRAFRLHVTGDGHWSTVRGCDPGGIFFDRKRAEQVGRAWVETGQLRDASAVRAGGRRAA